MNNDVVVQFPSGFLASRRAAIPFRKQIKAGLMDPSVRQVRIDLKGVESISESFADESIGVLVKMCGFDTVKSKIKLINADRAVARSIAEAMLIRKKEKETGSIASAMAALAIG